MITYYSVLEETIDLGVYLTILSVMTVLNFIIFFHIKSKNKKPGLSLFAYVIPILSLVLLSIVSMRQYDEIKKYQDKFTNGEVESLSGTITNYKPIKYGVKGFESFELDNQYIFKYPAKGYQYVGYDITKRNGSLLSKGMNIEIWHYKGRILKMDIEE